MNGLITTQIILQHLERDIESFFQKLKYHMEEEYLRNLKMNVQL